MQGFGPVGLGVVDELVVVELLGSRVVELPQIQGSSVVVVDVGLVGVPVVVEVELVELLELEDDVDDELELLDELLVTPLQSIVRFHLLPEVLHVQRQSPLHPWGGEVVGIKVVEDEDVEDVAEVELPGLKDLSKARTFASTT